jgi:rod shape-determining protein MreC
LCALALAVLAVVNLPEEASLKVKGAIRDGVSPLQAGVRGGMREIGETWRYVRGIGDLALENRALSEEITYLRGELRLARELEGENRKLRDQLGFMQRPQSGQLVACEVIGRDSTGWWNTARLDKGRRAGIVPGRAVLTADGLAGRTVSVSERTADVLLLSDPACKVSVLVARSGVFGVVEGTGGMKANEPLCKLRFLSPKADVREGDEIVTSGMGGLFPKGLAVGTVRNLRPDSSDPMLVADVEPAANLGLLEYVFVSATAEDLAAAAAEAAAAAGPPPADAPDEELPDWTEDELAVPAEELP